MMMFRDWLGRVAPVVLIGLMPMLAAKSATAQDVPYTAIVVEDNVQVRAGAGRAYYVVGELDRGELVEVEEVIFGWLKILPPEGVHSYISKAFVDARGEGRRGQVNSNRTRITAASVEGPGNSYREQTLLNQGDEVRIVDEEGSFYKIDPPAGTFVFLPPGSVRRASDMEAAEEPAESDASSEQASDEQPDEPQATADETEVMEAHADTPPADEGEAPGVEGAEAEPREELADTTDSEDETVAQTGEAADEEVAQTEADDDAATAEADADEGDTVDADDTASATADADDEADADAVADSEMDAADGDANDEIIAETPLEDVDTPAVSDALREVEQRYLPAFDLPLEEQPFDRMIAAYSQVRGQNDDLPESDRRLIEHRLDVMERNQSIAATLIRLAELRDSADETDRALDERQRERDRRQPNYDAVGELLASTVYDGQNLPQLFRVVDPATGRTLGYVEPDDQVNPRRMLGRVVGIVGDRRLDAGLRLRVFDVRRIDVLESAESE